MKEIIIDGVDVSECDYYNKGDCICDNIFNLSCNTVEVEECYYKQLKRLEQTLKEIKEIAEKTKDIPCMNEYYCDNCQDDMTNGGETCLTRGRTLILKKISEVL